MKNPVSTYRVQLSPEYTLEDMEEILDYLEAFGISTIYSAPLFQARKGSSHGYDITNPFRLNKEIGKLALFKRISDRLQQKKMTWLQDIVPNHMAFDGDNIWLQDIFELGPEASQYNYFDIDWEKNGKLMAPFLGNPLEEVLANHELKLEVSKRGFSFVYFDHRYPAAARSYYLILKGLGKWDEKFRDLSDKKERWEELKEFLVREYQKVPDIRNSINKRLIDINASEEKLKQILDQQFFLPAHWKETEKEINYRRFFTINDLICLKMEDEQVFESYHRFILQLCEENLIQGLRIDHIDGLFDPKAYLERLREKLGPDFYIIIEKILEWDEKLPVHWPVEGTSGYGFLATVNQVLTNKNSEDLFFKAYLKVDPEHPDYHDLVYKQKMFILNERMGGEYKNLWQLAIDLELLEEQEDTKLKEALGAFLAGFPVYRIYPEEFPLRKRQRKIIEAAYQNALTHSEALERELEQIKNVFLGDAGKDKESMLMFLQRCQQFTGPLAAKGVEDTSFYIYNELISHNEVGDSPDVFGVSVEGFHKRMQLRREDFPLSINATATHDTKRGEDSRMRINVLSEIGEEWFENVGQWKEIGEKLRKEKSIPDANEEYFIYQMLIGAWPFDGEPGEEFLERSTAYLQKVLREAKVNSSWAQPDEKYEEQVYEFLKKLLKSDDFRTSFGKFHHNVSAYGAIKSLSQSLLKITAPGIPDVYQGTELWDLSYVDPDNRRPVDYQLRKQYLEEINSLKPENITEQLQDLKQDFPSGKIKMFCLHKALQTRKDFKEAFEEGAYLPLEVKGENAEGVIAFARKLREKVVIIVVPAMVTAFFTEELQLKEGLSNDLRVVVPEDLKGDFKNAFTGKTISSEEIVLNTIFADLPVALLIKEV
ncbi:maltooligosyl trehalose synthase [Salinimicrobium sediminis]|uniref:Maltooligosyl trehalose synthase n=1 Tax=Salinimicrobium sediminis TaxID=1343891 RepID=A0A285X473_9FLAO|nr:malto-oligosyltrehalose synthase [Salinimicrobium sediminis]SOC80147.1 maltooligosyl trehalose synthase [Salinimicrobium sediminis]